MANSLYDFGRESYLGGDLAWDTNDVRTILIDEGVDVPDLALDQDLADRTAGARIATSGALTTKTITAGVADAADVTFPTVSGASVESIDIYFHTGTESTSTMIANIDTATGLPVTPSGGDIVVAWDSGANKIFKL
jgi:hypothetical protein